VVRGPAAVEGRGRAVVERMRRRRRQHAGAKAAARRRPARDGAVASCDEHPPVHRRVPPRALLLACFFRFRCFSDRARRGGGDLGTRGVSEERSAEKREERGKNREQRPREQGGKEKTTDEKKPNFPRHRQSARGEMPHIFFAQSTTAHRIQTLERKFEKSAARKAFETSPAVGGSRLQVPRAAEKSAGRQPKAEPTPEKRKTLIEFPEPRPPLKNQPTSVKAIVRRG